MNNKSTHQSELILNLNERLFLNALQGVTIEQAKQRISVHNNPILWIATHIVWSRFNTISLLGKPVKNPYEGMFENFKPFEESMKLPALENVKGEWQKVSGLLKEAFSSVTEEHLAAESPVKVPIRDSTNGGAIAFLTQHESYSIGQLAILKKFYTKEAMSYN